MKVLSISQESDVVVKIPLCAIIKEGLALYSSRKILEAVGEEVKKLAGQGVIGREIKKVAKASEHRECRCWQKAATSSSVICVHKTPRRLKPKPVEQNTISRS